MWRLALENYYWDRLDEAFEQASALGAGSEAYGLRTYRLIEAEHLTRQSSRVRAVNDWLSVETIDAELGAGWDEVAQESLLACDDVAKRLAWTHGPPVLLTILADEADAPWTPGRHGFCVDKHPYEKICLPCYLLDDPNEFRNAVRHEYAHVVSLNWAQGKCPRWLDEAIAMRMGGELDQRALSHFGREPADWLGWRDLDDAYLEDREAELGRRKVWLAYQESALIGRFLVAQGGESSLGDLLRRLGRSGLGEALATRILERPPGESAVRQVYGFGLAELFEAARPASATPA